MNKIQLFTYFKINLVMIYIGMFLLSKCVSCSKQRKNYFLSFFGLFGLVYLSLSTGINTFEAVWDSRCIQLTWKQFDLFYLLS